MAPGAGVRVHDLPKTWRFTSALPADPTFPTPADSHRLPRDEFNPRQVPGALYTWVRPARQKNPELLAVSPAALADLGISPAEVGTDDFLGLVSGNKLFGWDEDTLQGDGYPWAQCYGGFQFGQWAGQLGDGRAISLFEATNRDSGVRYELQLKGAGRTPYSRFADGKAVLRSSIREWLVSESLNALGVPTTRALALTSLPYNKAVRDGFEPCAIVLRFAQSWLRLGSFDILRARGDRDLLRTLATYVAEDVFGGWDKLPGRLGNPDEPGEDVTQPTRGVAAETIEGPDDAAENRFTRMYREVARRNAITVAHWQAYGFMNGVLNTDNTSIYGLSIDYGPFAFMDNFDPSYTPNHDDGMLRYAYKNQPTIIWWNLVRFGEAVGEMMGAGAGVDDESYVKHGVQGEQQEKEIASRGEKLILQAGEEYKAVFLAEYKRLMTARLGLRQPRESDFDELFSEMLDFLHELELDFHHFFRRLSNTRLGEIATAEAAREKASVFFHAEGLNTRMVREADARDRIAAWLGKWRARVVEDWGEDRDEERVAAMKGVNPNFVPRGWVLDEVIRRVDKEDETDVLDRVMHMALHPFEDSWHGREFDGKVYEGDAEEEGRWTGEVPKFERALQCSCSS